MEYLQKKAMAFSHDSLLRNSFYLMANTLILAVFGFFFWILNAHFYTSSQVGLATTLVSLCTLLSSISFFGINISITHYLPQVKRKNAVINTSFMVTTLATLAITIIFLLGIPIFSPKLAMLQNLLVAAFFLVFMVIFVCNLLLEGIFVGYRSANYILIKNVLLSMTKLALPVLLAGLGAYGIFLSFSLATTVALVTAFFFLIRRFSYRPALVLDKTIIKQMGKFSFANYIANFIVSFPSLALPVIISNAINYQSSAYFYIDMMIANLLYIIPFATSQSLFAEGSHNMSELPYLLRKSLKVSFALMIPAVLFTVLFGNLILLVFGKPYAAAGSDLLRLLAASGLLIIANFLVPTVLKLKHKLRLLIAVNFLGTMIILVLSLLFLRQGLLGVGIAWVAGQAAMCVVYMGILFRLDVIKSVDQRKMYRRIAMMKNQQQKQTALQAVVTLLRREFFLLLNSPLEYLYSFTYPADKMVTIEKYNPRVTELGQTLITKLQTKHPELKVHFVGSAVLKIAGQKDVDLLVECKPENFYKYVPTFVRLFGEPSKQRDKFIEWHLIKNGCTVEILLIDPLSYIFQGPIKTFSLLKKHKSLRQEYERIKLMSNGVSLREYKKRRLEFFNRITSFA